MHHMTAPMQQFVQKHASCMLTSMSSPLAMYVTTEYKYIGTDLERKSYTSCIRIRVYCTSGGRPYRTVTTAVCPKSLSLTKSKSWSAQHTALDAYVAPNYCGSAFFTDHLSTDFGR